MFEFLIKDENGPGLTPPLERVPMEDPPTLTERESIFASAATAKVLEALGDNMEVREEDANIAREIFQSGRDSSKYEKQVPGVMLHLEALLSEYDKDVVADANQIRVYVTNKLLEETGDKDPKVRLKAYEMLGKITEVGLFTEKREISISSKSTEELESMLEDKLERLLSGSYKSPTVMDGEFTDPARESALAASASVTADDILKGL